MLNRRNNRGFTLIELLIVVGVISVLIVVLAVAILPWLKRSKEKATKTLLQQLGPVITGERVQPNLDRFKKDAGDLSKRISTDEHTALSQMMLFYSAPTREEWDESALYKDRNYEPKLQPDEFTEFTRTQGNQLPYLVDSWENPIWYHFEKAYNKGFLYSMGEDGQKGTPDDLIYDPRNNTVKRREEFAPK